MKKKIGRVKMYYFFYKNWQKFIHRFNYHHMKPNITKEYAWCHWCGLRDKIVDLDKIKDQILPPKETKRMKYTEAEIRTALSVAASSQPNYMEENLEEGKLYYVINDMEKLVKEMMLYINKKGKE